MAVGHYVHYPLFVEGFTEKCVMIVNYSGDKIPGMVFDEEGLRGAPTEPINVHTNVQFSCTNNVSTTNIIQIFIMIHSGSLQGLVSNYWIWKRDKADFPCKTMTSAFSTPGTNIELREFGGDFFNISSKKESFPYINEYFGVTWTGFIYIESSGDKAFETKSKYGSSIEIDGKVIINNMNSCDNQEPLSVNVNIDQGYRSIILNVRHKTGDIDFSFSYGDENLTSLLYFLPDQSVYMQYPIVKYVIKEEMEEMTIPFLFFNSTHDSESIHGELPNNFKYNYDVLGLTGTPKEHMFYPHISYFQCNIKLISIKCYFYISTINLDYVPEIPYLTMRYSLNRRIVVNPNIRQELGWSFDYDVMPTSETIYYVIKVNETSRSQVSCDGTELNVECQLTTDEDTYFYANYTEAVFHIFGTVKSVFSSNNYFVIASKNNNNLTEIALKITFSTYKAAPSNYVSFGVWLIGISNECAKYTFYNKELDPILELTEGFDDYLLKQGVLVRPWEYMLTLSTSSESNCKDVEVQYNITIDNKFELYTIPSNSEKNITFILKPMGCLAIEEEELPDAEVGTIIEFPCPGIEVGIITRRCRSRSGDFPYWDEQVSTCKPYISVSRFSYGIYSIDVPLNTSYVLRPQIDGNVKEYIFSSDPIGNCSFDSTTGVIVLLSETKIDEYITYK